LENKKTKKIDLSCNVGCLHLANPIILASGTFGGLQDKIVDINKVGGIVTKTITLAPREGNLPPRIFETASGLLNSIGLENVGIDAFVKSVLPKISRYKTKIIISIAGKSPEEYTLIVKKLNGYRRLNAIEVNLSCPNIKGGLDTGTNPATVEKIVRAVKNVSNFPVITKLTPNVTDITKIAKAAIDGGTDILSMINTIKAMAVNWRTKKSMLGGITGGLSGPAIKPVALRCVWEVASKFAIPIIGIGGISSAEDILEFMCVGAQAVEIGTANFVDPNIATKMLADLPKLLASQNITCIKDAVRTFEPK